jgi:hypothetical protein
LLLGDWEWGSAHGVQEGLEVAEFLVVALVHGCCGWCVVWLLKKEGAMG